MLPIGTILDVGQTIIKLRQTNKLSYLLVEISHVYNSKYYDYVRKGKESKTGAVHIDESEAYFLTKFDFLKHVHGLIKAHKKKHDANINQRKGIFNPERFVSNQVLTEIEANIKHHPEYWV